MTKEALINLKKKISELSEEELKQRNLYLRDLSTGEIQGPPTGYPSIDKPWLKFYKEENLKTDIHKKTCFQTLIESNSDRLDSIALEYFGRKITYKELFDKINEVSKAYKKMGVKKGDIVTFLAVNTPEVIYSFYALNKIGAIPNMVDPRNNVAGLEKYLKEVDSKYLVSLDLCYPIVKEAIKNTSIENVVVFSANDSLPASLKIVKRISDKLEKKEIVVEEDDKFVKWGNFVNKGKLEPDFESVMYEKDFPAVIVHTGGTTGIPKGVLLSNDNFNAVVNQVENSPIGMEQNDKFLNILVPFVAYGLALGLHTPMSLGWDSILVPKFEPKDIIKLMKKHKPQGVMGIATYYEPLLSFDKYDYSNSKAILMGGMPTKEEFEKNMNQKIKDNNGNFQISKGYSMTEASSCATCSYTSANKSGSNGVPLVKTVVAAFDPITGEELPYNKPGEICILTPTRMLEYYNNKQATDEVLKIHNDGKTWIHSGDIGYVTEEGFVYIIDRIKRMIIRKGFKVFPSEIENVFLKNSAVETCAVVGIDDMEDDKAPKAFIVLKKELNDLNLENLKKELIDSVEINGLPPYFKPVEFDFVDELPLTNIGKIDYKKLENDSKNKIK